MNNELIHINAPSLDDVNYATSLSEVFDNINQNFVTLANHDFIKGESGKSIEFVETKFFDENGNITDLGNKLKLCISELGDTTTVIYDDKQNEFTVWDNFTSETAGCIHMIYNTENDTPLAEVKPISSLQYIFKDGRFANTTIGKISNQSQYDNIADLSCVVIYDNTLNDGNGGFRALTNSISTLYYDKTIGLCWKINGVATGIPAQGVPGKDGRNSKICIVKCDSYQQPNDDELTEIDSEVTHIYDEVYGYVRLDSFDDEYKRDLFKDVDLMSALILSANSEDMTSGYKFYFGALYVKDNKLYANYNVEFSLNESLKSEELINYFKNISLLDENLDGASNNRGVFVPISTHDSVKQPVHLMTARPVDPVIDALYVQTNSDELKCNDLLLTPISDITDLEIDIAENKNLCVNRYLKMDFNDEIREYHLNGQYEVNNKKFIDRLKDIYPLLNLNFNATFKLALKFPEDLIVDEIYEWCYDKDSSNMANLYTLDVNPTKESHILYIKDLTRTEKYDESTGTTQLLGFEINFVCIENVYPFIGFYQKILNDFEVDNTTLNINYDINVSKSIKPANVNIDGYVFANDATIKDNIYSNNATIKDNIYSDNIVANKSLTINDRINILNSEFTFDALGDLIVMKYNNKPFILLKSNMPDFDNPDDIMVSGSMELKSETKKYNVSLPALSQWGEQCISGRFNVAVENYKYQGDLGDEFLGNVLPVDKFKYEINISPNTDTFYNYRYVVFTLDFPYPIDIDLRALILNNATFKYDFELKLVCNSRSRSIIKKSITNLLPQLIIEDFNSLTYILDLKTNEFLLINGKESAGFTDIG